MRYYTYRHEADTAKRAFQKVKFKSGKGYYCSPPLPLSRPFTMYDSVSVGEIPSSAEAVAGYVGGNYVTWPRITRAFPKAKKLSIAVASRYNAQCLDVEKGDATNSVAAGWFRQQRKSGWKNLVFYTSVSNAQALIDTLRTAGIHRGEYKLWTAHYSSRPHLCNSKCWRGFHDKADATQWSDKALGRNLDVSYCSAKFL